MKIVVTLILFLVWLPSPSLAAQPALIVTYEPGVLVNGSPVWFKVGSRSPLKALTGEWQGRRVYFEFDASLDAWCGLAGIELSTPAGTHRLSLNAVSLSGRRFTHNQPVTVNRANYRTIYLSVPPQFTEPDDAALSRITTEKALKAQVFSRFDSRKLWQGAFVSPIDNIVTEPFGVRRTFNSSLRSVHQGLDFRAPEDSPLGSINAGTVILARELFYEGGLIVIDHGQGLMSLYMHLSQIKVREGEKVTKRQLIGLTGATGRATGPHLHLGVRWQGIYIDPATLLNLPLN